MIFFLCVGYANGIIGSGMYYFPNLSKFSVILAICGIYDQFCLQSTQVCDPLASALNFGLSLFIFMQYCRGFTAPSSSRLMIIAER
jgi:hypothetical protein